MYQSTVHSQTPRSNHFERFLSPRVSRLWNYSPVDIFPLPHCAVLQIPNQGAGPPFLSGLTLRHSLDIQSTWVTTIKKTFGSSSFPRHLYIYQPRLTFCSYFFFTFFLYARVFMKISLFKFLLKFLRKTYTKRRYSSTIAFYIWFWLRRR